MPFWAVVRAVPHHDRLAAECVAMAGFETFTPKIRVKLESRRRTTPLFPGYFFTRIVDQWRVLERTMGVLSVVKVGTTPSRCPDEEIAKLIERSDPDGVIRLRARPLPTPRRVFTPARRWRSSTGRSAASKGSMPDRARASGSSFSSMFSARRGRSRSPPT
jgi:transcription antitermination factor NusG